MSKIIFYKILHKPTGLYYQPVSKSGNNLGKTGKIYTTKSNGVDSTSGDVILTVKYNSNLYQKLINLGYVDNSLLQGSTRYFHVSLNEFEKEMIQIQS